MSGFTRYWGAFREGRGPGRRGLAACLGLVLTAVVGAAPAGAQALQSVTLANGTEFLLVAQPLADATTVAWPEIVDGAVSEIHATTSGRLTLAADLDEGLGAASEAPPVIVAVGVAAASELASLLQAKLAERSIPEWRPRATPMLVEGGVDRRLGQPGQDAVLRLELALPATADPRRAQIEVLWELLPSLLGSELPALRARIDESLARLEAPVDPELAALELGKLRLRLAQLAAAPQLTEAEVGIAARRVGVRRLARLEEHPEVARRLVELWLEGGGEAVRQELFGVLGVTLEGVRDAASSWLPQHPGQATMVLPPQVFNPRFAAQPMSFHLENDLSVTVLERPGASLAALCLRPVILPDVDGEIAATVLTRLATELRRDRAAPPWVRVAGTPPMLELATSPDDFAELGEVLQRALSVVSQDVLPAAGAGTQARRRALDLMSIHLGLDEDVVVIPARLLRPSNLAIGAVVPDGETAAEALRKFGVGGEAAATSPKGSSLVSGSRTRVTAPGDTSVLVSSLELAELVDPGTLEVMTALLAARAQRAFAPLTTEILQPLVPGRQVLLLMATGSMALPELETAVGNGWSELTAVVREEELGGLRRRVAAELVGAGSGSLGRARRCAALAAGARPWLPAAQAELAILGVDGAELSRLLSAFADRQRVHHTGAGRLVVDRPVP